MWINESMWIELSLKPVKIQSSVNHAEFRAFRKSFCNFLHASGLSEADGGSKLVLAHLRSCIQESFLIKLETKQDPENAAQLYTLIEQYIDKTHPLVLRRLRFFKMKQDQNQCFTDFLQRVRDEEISCELSKMTPHDFILCLVLNACRNSDLRLKLLELSSP